MSLRWYACLFHPTFLLTAIWKKWCNARSSSSHTGPWDESHTQKLGSGAGRGSGYKVAAAAAATSLQSCPTLCDSIDSSPPGSRSLGFSRQERWSGSPCPSPMHESEKWTWSHSVVSNSSDPMDCSAPGCSTKLPEYKVQRQEYKVARSLATLWNSHIYSLLPKSRTYLQERDLMCLNHC